MEIINFIKIIDFYILGFDRFSFVSLIAIAYFFKLFYERLRYMDKYLRYALFIFIIFASEYAYYFIEARIDNKEWLLAFYMIYHFFIYNTFILLSLILVIEYDETFPDIWIVLKWIAKISYLIIKSPFTLIYKIFFSSNTNQIKVTHQQIQKTIIPPYKPKSKPKPKTTRMPRKSIKKPFLNSLVVYSSTNKKLNINSDEIGMGGEASVHESEDGSYAKIFNNKIDLDYKKNVVEKLYKTQLSNSIITPKELLFDKNKNFIGYTMEKKEGVELGKLLLPKGMQHFPKYTLADIIDLCITIINTYSEIHKESIIVGDINPRNILVYNKTTISIIDTDSFQIGKPSPAYLDTYRRRKYLDKNILSYMRSIRDDSYAITTLIFQLLHYGIPPYGGTNIEALKEAKYIFNPYYEDKYLVTDKTLIKAHNRLSLDLKKLFNDVFRNDKYVLISVLKNQLLAYKKMIEKILKK